MSQLEAGRIRRILSADVAAHAQVAARRLAERAASEGLVDVAYATYESPLGPGLIAATERGVVSVGLPNRDHDDLLAELAGAVSTRVLEHRARLDGALRELDDYFSGRRRRFDLELDWRLSMPGFRRRVLQATAKLPFGVTATYAQIAAQAGNPRAYRAAGSALGHNPIPILVPCHRVLRSGGAIGEYGGGPEMKKFLLRLEGAIGEDGRPGGR